jgi:medium-chain acyl-[acyl-carrier-protein] hydrolase
MNEPFKKKYEVHSYEVDASGRAQLPSLLNYLQDAAGDHAGFLGLGVADLLKNRLTWLLSRYHIKVVRYPGHGQRIEVSTWPSGKKGIFALRDFEVSDEEGRPVLAATTSWVLIDLDSKQSVRLNDFVPDDLTFNKRAIEDVFPTLPELEKAGHELTLPVLVKDLDFNRHVNNVVYIEWALEAALPETLGSLRPLDVEVSYRAEAFYGDRIVSKIQEVAQSSQRTFLHQIFRSSDGVELTRLRTVWG